MSSSNIPSWVSDAVRTGWDVVRSGVSTTLEHVPASALIAAAAAIAGREYIAKTIDVLSPKPSIDYSSPRHGGELVASVLKAHGVKFIFTLVGGHISPILVACERQDIRVIDTRHEATAVFAADAVARLTGTVGVAAVTAGPGLTNTITAVKNAQMAESPLVLIGGAAPTVLKGRGALQDIEQVALFKSICKLTMTVGKVSQIVPVMRRALQAAQEGVPGPVFVEFPIDTLYPVATVARGMGIKLPTAEVSDEKDGTANAGNIADNIAENNASTDGSSQVKSDRTLPKSKGIVSRVVQWYLHRHLLGMFAGAFDTNWDFSALPVEIPLHSASQVKAAARLLAYAKRPVILVGSQATLPPVLPDELKSALERIGAPCFLGGMTRGLLGRFPELHIRHKRRVALRSADVVIMVGAIADFRLDYGRVLSRKSKIIAVNRSAEQLYKNSDMFWSATVSVLGDPGSFVKALADEMDKHPSAGSWDGWIGELRERDDKRNEEIMRQADQKTEKFMNPLKLLARAEQLLDDDSILVADGGDFVGSAAYILRPRGPLRWLDPGAFGTLGVGGGFALGAKLVRPESEVWIIYGDGSLGYSVAEFDTFRRHNVPIIALVGNDACWTQIAREQVPMFQSSVACDLEFSDYHIVADGYGGTGFDLECEEDIDSVLAQAKACARDGTAALINCKIGKTKFREGSISV